MIDLQEVSKTYGSGHTAVQAVDHVSLTIQPQEFVLLLGPSGAGKTTLLSLIGGLLQPTGGTVQVAGVNLNTLDSRQLAQFRLHRVGFVFQFFQLMSALTARENVELVLRLAGHSRRTARYEAEHKLQRFGLSQRLTHIPAHLSGGEKQRVALARALALQPSLVIADEPTGSLDSHLGEEVIRLLRQLVDEEGRTVLVASHDPRLIKVATRVLQCEDGKVREE
ncbi:MAG: ABC transporter ATP-binding protein [Deltaproteobacteria bacterium]|nr:ABC transporter ATP-binding protein [Deltaproteobacteria bacterium]